MTETVRRNDDKSRYELHVDGELAGFALYTDKGDQRIMYHTEIFEAFGGRGLSSVLVTRALADIRDSGMRVVAVCPLVAAFLRKHPEQADIADHATPDLVRWLESTLE
ncbi:MAG TPA: GNAT family N-acetyltransferase [Amycolatopsis sp.]|nr:GNAT family N-acetyltransferase [Amycolatopsis sp.]